MGYFYTQLARVFEGVGAYVGIHLTVSLGGIMFLGVPLAMGVGAYGVVIFGRYGASEMIAVTATLILATVVGAGFAYLYARLSYESFTVLTLASVFAFDALVKSWNTLTGGVLGIAGIARPSFGKTFAALLITQAIVAAIVFFAEWVFLQTPYGRALRGLKENKVLLAAQGIAPNHVGAGAIVIATVLAAIAGMFVVWRVQFLDPSLAGVLQLLPVLSVGVLAFRPSVQWLAAAAVFVTLLPEALRFLDLPSNILGHARILLYAVVLIILLKYLARFTSHERMV